MPRISKTQIKEIQRSLVEKILSMEGVKAKKGDVKEAVKAIFEAGLVVAEKKERSKSAYMFFNMEQQKDPKIAVMKDVADRSKEIGARWAALTNKSKYETLAAKDKERVEKENKAKA